MTRATKPEIHGNLLAQPFFCRQQKLVDTAGRVRFQRRYELPAGATSAGSGRRRGVALC
jgi:hypothetical protein